MQDLVGDPVADAAEEAGIGQRALQRVVLAPHRFAKRLGRRGEQIHAAGIVQRQHLRAAYCMERRALLGVGFRQHQRAVGEIECRQPQLPRQRRACLPPVEPPGDHQMQHQIELIIEVKHDALAEPRQLAHRQPFEGFQRRIDGPQQERAAEPNALQLLADDARFQRARDRPRCPAVQALPPADSSFTASNSRCRSWGRERR